MESREVTENQQMIESRFDLSKFDWVKVQFLFLRILACLTLLRGVTSWAHVIGFFESPDFSTSSLAFQTLMVFTAVVSLIAGIGLWLTGKWGAALWLFIIVVTLVVDFMVMISHNVSPDLARPIYKSIFDLFLLILYFGLSAQSVIWESKHIRI